MNASVHVNVSDS
ncbi:BnaCnng64750D [Brassica napus]|uniref:BnaCnng64750D protein n=2 Tax=Brassica TaxID=3705 RepID=A0A078JVW8_BRANA|nr:BnaCnng64750D [Brassica napus]